jgi:transposase InsO family protein
MGWVEWRRESELAVLASQQPGRYQRDADGNWRCPPGEAYAASYGLQYAIRTDKSVNLNVYQNMVFLEDYFSNKAPEPTGPLIEVVRTKLGERPGLALAELIRDESGFTPDDIFAIIARGLIYCDFTAARLHDPERVQLYADETAASAFKAVREASREDARLPFAPISLQPGQAFCWDEKRWTILNAGATKVFARDDSGNRIELEQDEFTQLVSEGRIVGDLLSPANVMSEAHEILLKARPEDLALANSRYELIRPLLSGGKSDSCNVTERTLYTYLKQWRSAEASFGCGYVGLLPGHSRKGNRTSRLPEESLQCLNEIIKTYYENNRGPSIWTAYGRYLKVCEERGGITPASYKTFNKHVRFRPMDEQTRNREGRKRAYQHEEFYWQLDTHVPRHGTRPFEIAHIDHTELQLEIVSSKTRKSLGRIWLTLMVDAYTRSVLAFILSFEPPSYRSCMMVIRDCVRRHGRLPMTLVVDRGAEFDSVYFQTLLARFQIIQKSRPPSMPRFGNVIERLFGATQSQLIDNLLGNTKVTRNVRQMTPEVDPKRHAIWTIEKFDSLFDAWVSEFYAVTPHPALGESPKESMGRGLRETGLREFKLIPYDENFRLLTSPTTPRGVARVHPARGIKINYLYYWSPSFRNKRFAQGKIDIPIRYDAYNVGIAYALVDSGWVVCHSERYADFQGRTEREIRMASSELRQQKRGHERQRTVTAKALATFLMSAEAEETLALERGRESEMKRIREKNGISSMAVETSPLLTELDNESLKIKPQPKLLEVF